MPTVGIKGKRGGKWFPLLIVQLQLEIQSRASFSNALSNNGFAMYMIPFHNDHFLYYRNLGHSRNIFAVLLQIFARVLLTSFSHKLAKTPRSVFLLQDSCVASTLELLSALFAFHLSHEWRRKIYKNKKALVRWRGLSFILFWIDVV